MLPLGETVSQVNAITNGFLEKKGEKETEQERKEREKKYSIYKYT